MNITLTGAAGKLGIPVCHALIEAGYRVRAVDHVPRQDLPTPVEVVNLLEREACYSILEGADAVVHLANHSHEYLPDKQRLLIENVAMNTNIFQAARELGVGNIVFSSSIQALGVGRQEGERHVPTLAYLPIDGDLPARPTNVYGLSKQLSEEMLRYYAREAGMNCVALRFPFLSDGVPEPLRQAQSAPPTNRINEAWSYLSLNDATALILAVLASPPVGFRLYCPGASSNRLGRPVGPLIEQYFSGVALKKPLEEMESFFDNSRIKEEIGWEPRDEGL